MKEIGGRYAEDRQKYRQEANDKEKAHFRLSGQLES